MDRPITNTKIKTVIKNLPTNKNPQPSDSTDKSTDDFYQKFREELVSILLKLSRKLQRKESNQTHSMRPPSPDSKPRDATKKENYRPISLMNMCKNSQENSRKQNLKTH